MLCEKALAWGQSRSCIRELAAYGTARKAGIGEDKVFDFSIGNPSVPAPKCVEEALRDIMNTVPTEKLHAYTAAPGRASLRTAIANDLNSRWNTELKAEHIYVCCGAAAGLASCMKALTNPGEQVVVFAPFFPEYRVFVEGAGAELVSVPAAEHMQPDMESFRQILNEKTGMVIINSPNNPSGVILSAESMKEIADIMLEAEEKYGHPIYLVSDEPYRELVYDDVKLPCVFDYYSNSIVVYSFSKSMSLPGERIGYVAVNPKMEHWDLAFAAIAGAARCYGYVNPPSMMQMVVERCVGQTADVSIYKKNRDLLCGGLQSLGFDCVKPDGAFYLFVKCPTLDAKSFSETAKKYELLLVPGDDFGLEGYVRVAYCVSEDTIRNSMPAFEKLAKECGLK